MLHLLQKRSFGAMTASQFLGAFNDNAFKVLLLMLVTGLTGEGGPEWVRESWFANELGKGGVGTLFALPFVLFGPLTGSLADRVSKSTIIKAANVLEIVVMGIAALFFVAQWFDGLLLCVFLMGSQSALFGPAKYGVIKEMVGGAELGRANALIQSSTMIAVLMGNMTAGFIKDDLLAAPLMTGLWYIGFATAGWLLSTRIQHLPAVAPTKQISWNPLRELRQHWRATNGDRILVLSVIASAIFYLLATVYINIVIDYGDWLGLSGKAIGMLNGSTVIGIVIGALIAGRVCRDHVEGGLIPLGLLGMTLSTLVILIAPSKIWVGVTGLVGMGICSGLFTIPIRCLIQGRPSEEHRGAIQGLAETMDFVGILLAGGVTWVLEKGLDLDAIGMLWAGVAMCGAFALAAMIFAGEYALRLVLLIFTNTVYRLRVRGIENVPEKSGALLVCNHVSFLDAVLLQASCPRNVRFLMFRDFFDLPLVGWFARRMGALPVSSKDSPEAKAESLRVAAQAAADGDLVCIFAEGAITRTGSLLAFSGGLGRIAKQAGVPIVPVAFDRLWGSIFSFHGGKAFWKKPGRLPYKVDVAYAPAVPHDTPAAEVRLHVQDAITELRRERSGRRGSLAWRFLYHAKRSGRRPAVVDTTGKRLSYRKLLIGSLALRSMLKRELGPQERVAVLLPPSAGGVLANLSLALLRRASVNLNYTMPNEALAAPLERAGVAQVLTSKKFLHALGRRSPLPEEGTLYLEELAQKVTTGDKLKAFLLTLLPAAWLAHWLSPQRSSEEVATIIFSSGSTGQPKGVQLTHGNVLSNVQSALQVFAFGPGDRLLGILPLFHSFGYTVTLWANLLSGAKAVYHSNPLEAKTVGDLCEGEGITVMVGTPTFYSSYLRRCRPEQFARVRLAISGAQKLPGALAEAWHQATGTELLQGYGATECAPVVSCNLPTPEGVSSRHLSNKPGTVGRPVPGVSVRIIDPDTREPRPLGEPGLIEVKGANVMLGYLGQREATEAVLQDGWYNTGDIGKLDRDGFLSITDRLSRFSKIGGEMVPHGRVEEALYEALAPFLPGPARDAADEEADVPELAVTAIEDERRGEELVVLCAHLPLPPRDLATALSQSDLPALFQPKPARYLTVEEIPKLGTGKVDLKGIKRLAQERVAGDRSEAPSRD